MIQGNRHKDTEDAGLGGLRPLATYDDRAAQEVEALNRLSEELARESETLKAELQRLNRQLQAGDGKLRIKALQAEQAQFEDLADRLSVELLRLRSEIGSIKIDLEPEKIDLEYERLTQEMASLINKREELNRGIPLLENEISTLNRDIKDKQARLEQQSRAFQDLSVEVRGLSQRVSALNGLKDAFSRQRGVSQDTYKGRLDRLSEGLKRRDYGILVELQPLCNELDSSLADTVTETRGIFGLVGSRLGLLGEIHNKELQIPALKSEVEGLNKAIREKIEALERLKTLNADDKKRAEELQGELAGLKEDVLKAAEEVARLRQLTSNRDTAEAEFKSLYVQNMELAETVQAVSKAMQGLKQMLR